MAHSVTSVATKGYFGTATSRVVMVATKGYFDILSATPAAPGQKERKTYVDRTPVTIKKKYIIQVPRR